ncbi:type II toxin-antitoxin system RelE/ParE family toxin [Desulfobacca acetoxidans]|uniref:Type II toxin-antitoxin system RelE/ParE family toxin n=1 Tax=Desulfobacca acetoxidans (strain ATCC 700848 / DSM 11109 / ASRB2) TaxID=880072 RepID=F2NFG4_DESAR|nr:type II toxin-antitoxin system RelE/ParE family toxin [Desulfobacca acetoxidans]AEB10083.1 hypothetical protein Desac_2259 [Desulfobacca acetoxidans DSM 11109]
MSNKQERVFHKGQSRIILFAINENSCPAEDFLENELSKAERAKIAAIIKRYAEFGKINNRKQFKKIEGEDFWEFKSFQIRIFCYFKTEGRVVLTHGCKKKDQKLRRAEIERMKRIKMEYEKEDEQ